MSSQHRVLRRRISSSRLFMAPVYTSTHWKDVCDPDRTLTDQNPTPPTTSSLRYRFYHLINRLICRLKFFYCGIRV